MAICILKAHVVQLDTSLPSDGLSVAGREYRISTTNKMGYYAYVLQSTKNQKFYYGHTQSLATRLKEHNSGKTKSTKANVPYELVFYEFCETRKDAIEREKYFKTGSGRAYIKMKITKHT